MQLSFAMEYFGDCRNAIDFYISIFDGAEVEYRTFREMPAAEGLGISGSGLDMVWKSELRIVFGENVLRLRLSDSVLTAMKNDVGFSKPLYHPVVSIAYDEEDYVRGLFGKLYGGKNSEDIFKGDTADPYGIRWRYQRESNRAISYCLSFDGFCREVISFYESVFQLKAERLVKYGDLPWADGLSEAGKEMIFSAVLCFVEGECGHSLMLRDSVDAAISGVNSYEKNALLFYHGMYNPVFEMECSDKMFLTKVFDKIREGARLNRPLVSDTAQVLHGSLIDRYGICWNFSSGL